jgi:hypothetical protein
MGIKNDRSDFMFNNCTDAEVTVRATEIVNKMTGNPHFKNPLPLLDDLKYTIKKYNEALEQAGDGIANNHALKSGWRTKLEEQLNDLSLYVHDASQGDDVIISSAGFDFNKKTHAMRPLHKPENVSVSTDSHNNAVLVCCDVISRAVLYEVKYAEITPEQPLTWIYKASIRNEILIEGLNKGRRYAFQIAGVGSNLLLVWSDEISVLIP